VAVKDANLLLRGKVLRICLFVLLLHGLSHVTMVGHSAAQIHDLFVNMKLITCKGFSVIPLRVCCHSSILDSLLNFTASIVRLLTINSINAYITSWVLYLSGGSEDPRLLLPAWISIATVHMPWPLLALKQTLALVNLS
jgi:hypothetical protein